MQLLHLNDLFLARVQDNRAKVHFWQSPAQLNTYAYFQLAEGAFKVAAYLQALGLKRRDRVALMLPTHADFYAAFFGVLLAGGIPSALYPPLRLGRLEEWKQRSAQMFQTLGSSIVLTNPLLYPLLGAPVHLAKLEHCVTLKSILSENLPEPRLAKVRPEDVAFIQFSSGSTGAPKGVAITHASVMHNARALLKKLPGRSDRHSCVSWLPLYHDMGLVGVLISSMLAPGDLTLIPPELFIARPRVWLEALSLTAATVSVAPNFAYNLCAQRVKEADLQGLDLSHWRVALCGAEPIQEATFKSFTEKFTKVGFDPKAFTPVYGLAEATLAVSFSSVTAAPQFKAFDRHHLEIAQKAVPALEDGSAMRLAALGQPVPGMKVEIRSLKGKKLKVGEVGEVWVKGASIMKGYWAEAALTRKSLVKGWLRTGDRGFFYQKNLYLCGRYKDLIIIRGRNYDPATIEAAVAEVPGVRHGCSVALGHVDPESGTEALVLLVEYRSAELPGTLDHLAAAIKAKVAETVQLTVAHLELLAPGTLPRTSSGKLRRFAAKHLWEGKQLSAPRMPGTLGYLKESFAGYLRQGQNRLRKK